MCLIAWIASSRFRAGPDQTYLHVLARNSDVTQWYQYYTTSVPLHVTLRFHLKMKALSLLLVCALPSVVFSCLCSQIVSRTQTIEGSFCGEYSSSDVYTARVVGATCKCIPAGGDTNRLQCQDYTFATGNTSVVNVEVVQMMCRPPFGDPRCSRLATSLVGSGKAYQSSFLPVSWI